MAERKATNKYYPPDWDPSKGSINKYNHSHHLRARAKKLDKGILVVRFGMPFNVWCLKCENHIGAGVRYNAEKSRIGSYYDSPIFLFRMKCRLCDNYIEIKTDPKNFDYQLVSGARKQVKISETDVIELEHPTIGSKRPREPNEATTSKHKGAMQRLEMRVENKVYTDNQRSSLFELKEWRQRNEDYHTANEIVRKQYRDRRKRLEAIDKESRKIMKMTSVKIPLLRSTEAETALAEQMVKNFHRDMCNRRESCRRRVILDGDILTGRQQPPKPTQSSRNKSYSKVTVKLKKTIT